MAYIVDGHNLIPKIPGLSLRALDDEMQLIELLQEFCRVRRKKVELYFDNAPPGQAQVRKFGWVTARFIRQGSSADQAIHNRLEALGAAARNWTVVSSDQAVQSSARRSGASAGSRSGRTWRARD
jgi:predicted RNA-binding protein with PIN domain